MIETVGGVDQCFCYFEMLIIVDQFAFQKATDFVFGWKCVVQYIVEAAEQCQIQQLLVICCCNDDAVGCVLIDELEEGI